MRRGDVISFMDLGLSGGLLKGERFMAFVSRAFEDRPIEDLAIPFAAVATSLESGAEVWLRTGSTLSAVRASMAMPGLFTPVLTEDGVLVDGALVNPVPVSLARAMGADVVIAVDLSAGMVGRGFVVKNAHASDSGQVSDFLRKNLSWLWPADAVPRPPSVIDVIASSLDIMEVRITRSRMAGEPPDVIVAPRIGDIGLLDFHRAAHAVHEGERAMTAALANLGVFGIETAAQ
jgi:NTE family protein